MLTTQKCFFHRYCSRAFFLITLLLIISKQANAATIVQPIGTVVEEWNPVSVNQYLEKWDSNIVPGITDPFDTRYAVSEVQPTKSMYFVRVYTEPNSGPLGSFIVRASVIRGMTPAQIRNILALPELPTKLVYVKVPAGAQYGLWTGIAGRIESPGYQWGEGGGEQTKIIGKETNSNPPADPARFANYSRLPADSYMNAQLIGNKALSYAEGIKTGNANKLATYFDKHIPKPYSDMEMVYATFDYINGDGPRELAAAFNQISPINFDTYSTVLFRNDLLFNNLLFGHAKIGDEDTSVQNLSLAISRQPLLQRNKTCFASWISIAGEQGEQSEGDNRVGFYYQTGALTGGVDCRILPNMRVGVGAGYFRNHLGWNASGGNADMNNTKIGVYSSYTEADYFLNSALTGGLNWSSAERNMNFSGVGIAVLSGLVADTLSINRIATSNQTGQNVSLYFTGGKNFQWNEWNIMPIAQLSYFYSRQGAFNESGADDLDLHVDSFTAQTVRSQLAMSLGKLINLQQGSLVKTTVQLGWAHNFPLDNRVITANFPAVGGEFSVHGYNQDSNELLASAGFSTKVTRKFWIDGQYNADLSHGFNSQTLSLILKYYFDIA